MIHVIVIVKMSCHHDAARCAHCRHELDELKDACAELMDKNMTEVSQSDGFQRLSAERPQLAAELYKHMGYLRSPEGQSRKCKRKRSEAAED